MPEKQHNSQLSDKETKKALEKFELQQEKIDQQ